MPQPIKHRIESLNFELANFSSLLSALGFELGECIRNVEIGRAHRDPQRGGDLPIRLTFPPQVQRSERVTSLVALPRFGSVLIELHCVRQRLPFEISAAWVSASWEVAGPRCGG